MSSRGVGGLWIGLFLRCLKTQKDNLARRLDHESMDDADESELLELSVRVLELLRANKRQTISELAAATGANRNTLKVRLRELVDAKKIQRFGKARATWYSI